MGHRIVQTCAMLPMAAQLQVALTCDLGEFVRFLL